MSSVDYAIKKIEKVVSTLIQWEVSLSFTSIRTSRKREKLKMKPADIR